MQKALNWGWKGYKFLSAGWKQLLLVQWGYVSECKHEPSCSDYMKQQVERNGWSGFKRGLDRLWHCR